MIEIVIFYMAHESHWGLWRKDLFVYEYVYEYSLLQRTVPVLLDFNFTIHNSLMHEYWLLDNLIALSQAIIFSCIEIEFEITALWIMHGQKYSLYSKTKFYHYLRLTPNTQRETA